MKKIVGNCPLFAVQVEVKCFSHTAQPPERVVDFRYSRGDKSLSPPVGDKVVLQNHWTDFFFFF